VCAYYKFYFKLYIQKTRVTQGQALFQFESVHIYGRCVKRKLISWYW